MNRYIFFTNIPTPYRTAFYNDLHEREVRFEVLYMQPTHKERNWKLDEARMRHPYVINRGFYRMIGRFHVHFNPGIIRRIVAAGDVDVIIGANWNDPDVLLLA